MTATVADGKVVSIHYTLKNGGGDVLDSSQGEDPLVYLHGAGNIVPGLEKQIAGKGIGDAFDAVVSPAEGYGERKTTELVTAPRSEFPDDMPLEEGVPIIIEDDDGNQHPAWVAEVSDTEVKLDPNHPLAGETLHFSIEVLEIRDATDDEKSHGHVHGPGGHH